MTNVVFLQQCRRYFYHGFQRVLNFNAGLDFYPASWFFIPADYLQNFVAA
jgi:hypothetical protein